MCLWKKVVWQFLKPTSELVTDFWHEVFVVAIKIAVQMSMGFFEKKIPFETKLIFTFHQASTNRFFTFGEGRKVAWRSFWNGFLRDQRKFLLESMFSLEKKHFFWSGFHTLSNKYKTLAKVSRPVCHIAVWVSSGVFRWEWFLKHF